jgi:hypothetical protein
VATLKEPTEAVVAPEKRAEAVDGLADLELEANLDDLTIADLVVLESMGEPGTRFSDAVDVLERCITGGVRHLPHKALPLVVGAVMAVINAQAEETEVSQKRNQEFKPKVVIDSLTIGDLEILESIGTPTVLFSKVATVLDRAVVGGIMHLNHAALPLVIEAVMESINAASNPPSETGKGN